MTTAWVFPGQGSQYVGMARDLYDKFSASRLVLDAADSVLGFSLSKLMFEGPEAELTDTVNAQPALLAHSIAALIVERLIDVITMVFLSLFCVFAFSQYQAHIVVILVAVVGILAWTCQDRR